MEILSSIAVGAAIGVLVAVVCRSAHFRFSTSLAVGILGGLLGLASDFWLGTGGHTKLAFSEYLASGIGASLALFLWIVAQLLFFGNPPERAIND